MQIEIRYDGKYPNLCAGRLIAYVIDDNNNGIPYDYGTCCLNSGGSLLPNYEGTEKGPWTIEKSYDIIFDPLLETLKQVVENAVNEQVEYGCCGGCI